MTTTSRQLRGLTVLILNWRDVRHPQAGGAEQYMHQIARRWVAQGVAVTWLTARPSGSDRRQVQDGIEVVRLGGSLTVYLRAGLWLLRHGRGFAAVVDCQNGIPFFAPAWTGWRVPVVQVVHHVHQDQFATRFSRPMAAVGRFLEGPLSRWVYGTRAMAAVSASTREEVRRQLGFRGPIFIVPNGTAPVPRQTGPRDHDPRIVVVTRLVPHKRIDLLLQQLASAARQIPCLHVDIVGDGSELDRLRKLTVHLGLSDLVVFHGRQPDVIRDELLRRAWLTLSTSAGEGWGCSIVEAAGLGVPCLALQAAGVCDSIIHGSTGWLLHRPDRFGQALVDILDRLADAGFAQQIAAQCQTWARCFSWERSADLLAGVILHQIGVDHSRGQGVRQRRYARSDIAALACWAGTPAIDGTQLRATDQVHLESGHTSVLMGGCDEVDAGDALARLDVVGADVRLADRHDLLVGPQGLPASLIRPTLQQRADTA